MLPCEIHSARSETDLEAIRVLFEAYTKSLGIDLAYQDYATEVSSLPGKYAEPTGALLIACDERGTAVGCAALRSLIPNEICEMKRLYVAPSGRGTGVGKSLAVTIIEEARRLGYNAIRLDTLPSMQSAQALYASLGFEHIAAYYDSPVEGTVFLEKRLVDEPYEIAS